MRRISPLWLPSFLTVALLIFGAGCDDSATSPDPDDETPMSGSPPMERPLAGRLADVVNLSDSVEIGYTWTGNVPGGGPGRVIYRTDGERRRWDSTAQNAEQPTIGDFHVYRTRNATTEVYGCHWIAAAEPSRTSPRRVSGGWPAEDHEFLADACGASGHG